MAAASAGLAALLIERKQAPPTAAVPELQVSGEAAAAQELAA